MKRLLIIALLACVFVATTPASAYTLPINWSSAIVLGYQEAPFNYSVSLASADAMCDADPNEPDGSQAAYGRTDPYQVNWWPTANRSGDYSAGSKVGEIYHSLGNHSGTEFDIQAVEMYCTGTMYPRTMGYFIVNGSIAGPAPIADFYGTPINGTAPLTVTFTDNSTNWSGASPVWNWSVSPIVAGNIGNSGTNQNHVTYFTNPGNYTITHGLSTAYGSSIKTRTDYIRVLNSSALVTTAFRATDGVTGNRITGATIHLNDVENGSWSNSSTVNGVATISVMTGHHISAYANATGFSDGEYLNAPAMAWTYDVMMLPVGFTNVSAGNVTAYITVTDTDTLQKLYGAQVNAMYADGAGSHILEGQTNSAGVASFVLPNNTNVHFQGVKSGYESSQLVLNTGTGSGGDSHVEGELKMSKLAVTPTITATTLPGGGTPTPTTTVLPGCEDLTTQEGKDKCNAAQGGEMMGFLYENGLMLIELCVAAIVFGLLGMIIKSF